MSKYNERVRQAISDEFVRCSKERREIIDKISECAKRLSEEQDTMPYKEYLDTEKQYKSLKLRESALTIELDTWDKAREVCLNVADEL